MHGTSPGDPTTREKWQEQRMDMMQMMMEQIMQQQQMEVQRGAK
jgi:hypothetical protein